MSLSLNHCHVFIKENREWRIIIAFVDRFICLSYSNQNVSKLENVSNLITTVYLHLYLSIYVEKKTTEHMKEVDLVMISISIINYRLQLQNIR